MFPRHHRPGRRIAHTASDRVCFLAATSRRLFDLKRRVLFDGGISSVLSLSKKCGQQSCSRPRLYTFRPRSPLSTTDTMGSELWNDSRLLWDHPAPQLTRMDALRRFLNRKYNLNISKRSISFKLSAKGFNLHRRELSRASRVLRVSLRVLGRSLGVSSNHILGPLHGGEVTV